MNKLIIHYCGGAGINIGRSINNVLDGLGEGFCSIVPRYIDSSANNIDAANRDSLWRIGSDAFVDAAIDGSGGERKTNIQAIMASVKCYLDENKHTASVTGEYHVVVFSASGGTGSVVGPILTSNLRSRGIPVLAIMIGDSSNGLFAKNTLNTIASLDNMAKRAINKPIVMMYHNNHAVDLKGVGNREATINEQIADDLTILSMFLSGKNEDIDTRDMINFLSPDNYETITIEPSLYAIEVHTKNEVRNNPTNINLIGRTLVTPTQDSDIGLTLLQHKYGLIVEPNAISKAGDSAPVHIILTGNHLVNEHAQLTATVEEYAALSKQIKTDDLHGAGTADDSGMVF